MSTVAPSLSGTPMGAASTRSGAAPGKPLWRTDVLIYLALLALTFAAWWVSEQGWFTSWSRIGYWLGVAGGVSMVLLMTYPLRKRWRVTYNWGKTKHWFTAHMVLGVMGPWLILLHSTFHIGSTNAAVALFSMLIVALSGVAGRFLYMRLHAGLRGEKASLNEMREVMGRQHEAADAQLKDLPKVLEPLHDFEAWVLDKSGNQSSPAGYLWRLFVLPARRRSVVRGCRRELRVAIRELVKQAHWTKPQALAFYNGTLVQVNAHAQAVQRVAQFQAFERLFSLWHVAHVPFVWIMVFCAIFHVVAVHAY